MAKSGPEIVATISDTYTLEYSIPRIAENRLKEIGAGQKVTVDIKRWRKQRTGPQNAYLWAVVYPTIKRYIKDKTGQDFTVEELHEDAKREFLGYEVCAIPGAESLTKVRSSTELDIEDFFEKLVEHLCRKWAMLGLFIPLPDKDYRLKRTLT